MTDDTDANYLRAAALAFQIDDPIRLRLMEIAERLPRPVCDDKELTAIARALAAKNEAEQRELRAAQENDELQALYDSEVTRAVEYLRRARAAEADAGAALAANDAEIERLRLKCSEHRDGRLAALERVATLERRLQEIGDLAASSATGPAQFESLKMIEELCDLGA